MAVGLRNLCYLALVDDAPRKDAENAWNRILRDYVQSNHENIHELFNSLLHVHFRDRDFDGDHVSGSRQLRYFFQCKKIHFFPEISKNF